MKKENAICELEGCFDKNRNGVTFHGDKSARITIVVDGSQLADVAKLLLLVGQEKTFIVRFYATNKSNEKPTKEKRQTKPKRQPRLKGLREAC